MNTNNRPQNSRGNGLLVGDVSPIQFAFAAFFIFVTIFVLARMNLYTFPLPNEDDSRFFFPAWTLAQYGSLHVPILNAPDGIFWVPDGLYVFLAFFLRIFGPTMQVAHVVCQVTIASAMVLLIVAYSRLSGSRGFALLCGLLLISPGVIFASNTVRMEPLILLLFSSGLFLHTFERRLAAAAVFSLGVVVHPALLMGACLYALSVFCIDVVLPLVKRERTPEPASGFQPSWVFLLNTLIVSAVVTAIALESLHVMYHLATFHQHMAYQVARKAARHPLQFLKSKRGLLLIAELLITSAVARTAYMRAETRPLILRQLLPVFLVALGLSAYATFGREIPYNVYSYAVVPATFFCLTYRVLILRVANKVVMPLAPSFAA